MSTSMKFLRPTMCKSLTGSGNSRTKVLGRVRGRHLEGISSSETNSKMGQKQTPSDFLKQFIGRPVVVKLNNGVDYRGKQLSLACACNPAENSSILSLTVHSICYQLQTYIHTYTYILYLRYHKQINTSNTLKRKFKRLTLCE